MSSKKSGHGSNAGNFSRTNYGYGNNINRNQGQGFAKAVTLTTLVVDVYERIVLKFLTEKDHKEYVIVQPLYDDNNSIDLTRAVETLKDYGVKPEPIPLYLTDARAKYRKCFDLQVVDPVFMRPQKREVGKPVTIRYITQEVINESQRLFDESERQKAETDRVKGEKRAQNIVQIHTAIAGTLDKAKETASKILPHREKEYSSDDLKK